jgi:hypothetical protein
VFELMRDPPPKRMQRYRITIGVEVFEAFVPETKVSSFEDRINDVADVGSFESLVESVKGKVVKSEG